MAIYRRTYTLGNGANTWEEHLALEELPLYGSARLGLRQGGQERSVSFTAQQVAGATTVTNTVESVFGARNYNTPDPTGSLAPLYTRQQGGKVYELTDHLGNVRAVVSDRKRATNNGGFQFLATVESFSEYYPFGSLLQGRHEASNTYRFGFQGQEKDDEIHGATGTSYAFEYRMHDPRVGRFLSIDPLAAKYAYNSPYAFSENRVIDGIELEGLEVNLVNGGTGQVYGPLANPQKFANENPSQVFPVPNDGSSSSSLATATGNVAKGLVANAATNRFQPEPARGATVAGVRDMEAGRTGANGKPVGEPVIRVDKPHGNVTNPHININPNLTGLPDPHTPIGTNTLEAARLGQRGLASLNKVAVPVAIVSDAYRLGVAIDNSNGDLTSREVVKTAGSVAGGWGGAWLGACLVGKAGAGIGAACGAPAAGVGAVPGAALGGLIGGIVGGIGGAFGGSWLGETGAEQLY